MIGVRRARPLLGTRVEALAWGGERPRLLAALGAALDEVARIHALLSFHDTESELNRLHRLAHLRAQPVDRRTLRVLRLAVRLWRQTGGAFDPTVAGRLVATGHLPRPEGAPSPDETATLDDVVLRADGRVAFRRPLWLDLGGLAKGYAVDRAVAVLRRAGVRSGAVEAGGDLRVFGDRPLRVAIRHPVDAARSVAVVELASLALASSSDEPLPGTPRPISPAGDRPPSGRGVTVIARSCASADAWTKGVLFAPEVARRELPRIGARALCFDGAQIEWLDGRSEVAA